MSRGEPSVLAAYLQANLITIEEQPELARRVESHMRPGSLHRIRTARRTQWLPWPILVEASEAIFRASNCDAHARATIRQAVGAALEDRHLRPLVRGALRLLGRHPRRLVRWVPTAWGVVCRNAGTVRWSAAGRAGGVLRWEDAPRASRESPTYLNALEASVHTLFDVTETPGTARCLLERDVVEVHLRWE